MPAQNLHDWTQTPPFQTVLGQTRGTLDYRFPGIGVTGPPPPVPVPPRDSVRYTAFDAPLPLDFGSDVSVFPDLDATFSSRQDSRVLTEAIARRLVTPRGGLVFAPDYGTDLRQWLSDDLTVETLDQVKSAVEAECLKDERIEDVQADVSFAFPKGPMHVSIQLVTAEGPFRMVLSVDAVAVNLLSAEAL